VSKWDEREAEARQIADTVAAGLQRRSHAELAGSIGKLEAWTQAGVSGSIYGIEVESAWEPGQNDVLRVSIAVFEDGRPGGDRRWPWQRWFWTTFCPVTTDLLVRPPNETPGQAS
jgi:hypothetical protein